MAGWCGDGRDVGDVRGKFFGCVRGGGGDLKCRVVGMVGPLYCCDSGSNGIRWWVYNVFGTWTRCCFRC